MNKLPWAKYYFGTIIAAAVVAIVARFIIDNVFVLAPVCVGIYWISVKGLEKSTVTSSYGK